MPRPSSSPSSRASSTSCRSRSTAATYCDAECALDEAQTLLAGDPSSLQLLTVENIPTNYKVKPTDATQSDTLSLLRDSLRDLPNVGEIILAQDYLDIIGKLQGFVGLYTVILSVTLLSPPSC